MAALNNVPSSLIRVRLNWNLYCAVLIKRNLGGGGCSLLDITKEGDLRSHWWKTSWLSRLWASTVTTGWGSCFRRKRANEGTTITPIMCNSTEAPERDCFDVIYLVYGARREGVGQKILVFVPDYCWLSLPKAAWPSFCDTGCLFQCKHTGLGWYTEPL